MSEVAELRRKLAATVRALERVQGCIAYHDADDAPICHDCERDIKRALKRAARPDPKE